MVDKDNKILHNFRQFLKEDNKHINESTGGYIRNLINNLQDEFTNSLSISNKISDKDIVNLNNALASFRKTVEKTLKGKGLIGF